MLQRIKINNFQSLHDVDIEFGKFTVIVGASSSGKSAFTRALKAVASNALNSDYITQGTKHSAVSVTTDKGTVTIERNAGGSSAYKVNPVGGKESSFTKLNRQVPSEVTEVLGLSAHTQEVASINFASQFDPPYLLKESSSNVARILGELTNVSTIFAAVKEANRKVKNASGVLNLRKKDMEKVVAQITNYTDVGNQARLVTEAEQHMSKAKALTAEADRLRSLLSTYEQASDRLSAIKQIDVVPDLSSAIKAQQNLDRLVDLLRQVKVANSNIKSATSSDLEAQSAILSAENDLHRALQAIGQCPLCNQEI